ncbi:hypothetical protein CDL15_Pgr009079 [Punica granatum]|uniref:Uncharacterized protein n=1 Tax=Punica granatum TaxID=22663 RepID=A0A218VZ05_PUNGR|nr:hypothetical protein CDL15_Pgr009079 [Punica granatum]PKI53290.1 hypothetical protein CRG98_026318 [Punica granatum]
MANSRLSFLGLVPFSTRRANVYYIVVVAICCNLFYVVGIWQHSGTGSVSGSVSGGLSPLSIVSKTPCNVSHTATGLAGPPRSTSSLDTHRTTSYLWL